MPSKIMNKMRALKVAKEMPKAKMVKKHHVGKGTKARLNTAAEKHMFGK